MTLQQFLLILRARRKLIGWVFGVTVLTTLIISLVLPKQYSASTTVVVDVKSPDPIAGMVLPGLMAPGYMATQVDIINSSRVAQRVVRMMKMDQIADIREQWQDETDGKGDIVVWLAELLQKKLDVKPSRESNVIEIVFTGVDPDFAAAVANAFAQAYIDTNIDLRVEPAKQYATWFDRQIKTQRERLETAQKALSDYQQQNGIVATDERLDYETQKLNELSAQLTMAQAQGADSVSKRKQGGDTLAEVIQNPLVNQLKADVARMESRNKELAGNLGANHPQYQRAQAELEEMKARLQNETARINTSINTAARVSVVKEGELQAQIEAQKKRVLDLRKQRDEISVLQRDVDNAQKAFDAVGLRMAQSQLESQSIQTNVSVLTQATAPIKHSKPKLILNVVISMLLGGMLAIGTALFLEMGQHRVRAESDLVEVLDLPVLVTIDSTIQLGSRSVWKFWAKKPVDRSNAPSELPQQA
jgi:chain length determinant protein EpsF